MSKVIDTIDILIKDIYSYEHWGELDYGYTKTDIRNDVERVRRHLEEKYVIKYGTGVFAGIEQLVMSKWIDCPQPGSMAVNTKYFYDKYIKVAKEYIEYIETECEGIIRENIEKVENYVNSNVYTRLVNEIQVVYDKAGIMEKILPIRRFTYEPQTLFQLVIIDVADIELEWKNRSVRWYIDNVERFIADVKASLNNLLFQMKDMLNKILIEEVQCHINEYLRLETQHVRKRLLEKKEQLIRGIELENEHNDILLKQKEVARKMNESTETILNTIKELHGLFQMNIITEEEFQKKKEELLKRL